MIVLSLKLWNFLLLWPAGSSRTSLNFLCVHQSPPNFKQSLWRPAGLTAAAVWFCTCLWCWGLTACWQSSRRHQKWSVCRPVLKPLTTGSSWALDIGMSLGNQMCILHNLHLRFRKPHVASGYRAGLHSCVYMMANCTGYTVLNSAVSFYKVIHFILEKFFNVPVWYSFLRHSCAQSAATLFEIHQCEDWWKMPFICERELLVENSGISL